MEAGRAVAVLQARFRGRRWRQRWAACVVRGVAHCLAVAGGGGRLTDGVERAQRGVTRLQARQRARFTRREFEALRRLQREQQERQREAARRQRRVARGEQALAFLRRTSPEDLARIERLQQRRGARRIQRAWRAARRADARRSAEDVADPKDRVFAFDPFESGSRAEEEPTETLVGPLPSAADARRLDADTDVEALAARRSDIHERVRRKAREIKARDATQRVLSEEAAPSSDRRTRRELCEALGQLRALSAQRLARHAATYRAEQPNKQLARAQLLASCSNRLARLQAEQPPSADGVGGGASADVFAALERLGDARKRAAWRQHRGVVAHALQRQHWWQTRLAGCERDIRAAVARSPWEPGRRLWAWPPRADAGKESTDTKTETETDEIRAFLIGEAGGAPVADDEASAWWRAHCTQSHLSFLQDDDSAAGSKWTAEAVANAQLWTLMERTKQRRRAEGVARELAMRADRQDELVARGVAELEGSLLANTQLKAELAARAERRQERQSRAQQAAAVIQRHARGLLGRNRAREVRAEFFVTVRGRAIRKGRCEECGEQRAVLACGECQDSSSFCPVCWVHVHSTRRRRTHVALPIAAPLPLPKPKVAKGREASARPTSRLARGAIEAAGREDGVVIPRLALPAARSERLGRDEGREGIGVDQAAAALSGDLLGDGEHAALERTEQPAEQQPSLPSEVVTIVIGEDAKKRGADVSDVAAEAPAADAAPDAAAFGASPRSATAASNSSGDHTEMVAPEVEEKAEARRPAALVRRASTRGLDEKKRPAAKPSARPSLKDRMKAAAVDANVSVVSAVLSDADTGGAAPASDAPTPDVTPAAVQVENEARPSEAEQLGESGDRGGYDQAVWTPLVDMDKAKDAQEETNRESEGASATEAAEQQPSPREEEGGGERTLDEVGDSAVVDRG